MKRALKWIGIVLGSLIGIVLIAGVALHGVGKSRLNNAPEVATKPVAAAMGETAVARGEHLVNVVSQCRGCHGDQLEGNVFLDGEIGIYLAAPNLTSGQGGIGATYTDADWERAIRHGIGGDNRVLAIMPSNFFAHYSDADLAAVIAYLKTFPPVDSEFGPRRIGFPGSVMGGFVAFAEFTKIDGIDHAAVGGDRPPEGATAEYGQYIVNLAMCGECHAANLAGVVGNDGPPPGPNLTPGGELAGWAEQDFIKAIRSGVTPSGDVLDGEQMPWGNFAQMSDIELQAIWAYLQSLPALPDNS
ncbi:MAG: c-type cytochrome [Chloroflexi bacterium]|nr:c-type cytochrome [Chloroflexota bacterium]MBP7042510.1 c-type cytochrome [Chloroflexota bacterium]